VITPSIPTLGTHDGPVAQAFPARQTRLLLPLPVDIPSRRDRRDHHLYSVQELLKLPDPLWQVEGLIPQGSLVVMYGRPGAGKSFLALDLAHRVGEGLSWCGRQVQQGQSVYISAEGTDFTKLRVKAWIQEHVVDEIDVASPNIRYRRDSLQFLNPTDVDRLRETITDIKFQPTLLVIDTFARCFVGGDENASKDMGRFVDNLNRLQSEMVTGTGIVPTMLVIHHTGKDGKEERGSIALRGAADVMLKVSMQKDGVITIDNEKQKDEKRFPKCTFRLKEHQVGTSSDGRPMIACAVVHMPDGTTARSAASAVTPKQRSLLCVLSKGPDSTMTTNDLISKSGLKPRDLHNQCVTLGRGELITQPTHGTYRLTETGAKEAKSKRE
jgi:archaellum biogenesis ATPase FlaH